MRLWNYTVHPFAEPSPPVREPAYRSADVFGHRPNRSAFHIVSRRNGKNLVVTVLTSTPEQQYWWTAYHKALEAIRLLDSLTAKKAAKRIKSDAVLYSGSEL